MAYLQLASYLPKAKPIYVHPDCSLGYFFDHTPAAFSEECIVHHNSYIGNVGSQLLWNHLCFDDFLLYILDISYLDFTRSTRLF